MNTDQQAPWLRAWREWVELASTGFKATTNSGVDPRAASAQGFADAYQSFARALQQMLQQGDGDDFASRFIQTLKNAARHGSASLNNDDFLNSFLRSTPRAVLGAFPDAGAGQAWQAWSTTVTGWAQQLLALPSVGPQREWQEMSKAVQRAMLAEQQARAVVDEHYRVANRRALERFAATLESDDGAPITTLRALYDAWIDEAEAAYAERVMEDAFARDFAAWVDAGSATRLALRRVGGRLAALFDAPAREEIDALLARQHAMQRELDALRAAGRGARAETQTKTEVQVVVERDASSAKPVVADKPAPRTPRNRRDRKTPTVKTDSVKASPPPRVRTPSSRKGKPSRGEFDIGHILDGGK